MENSIVLHTNRLTIRPFTPEDASFVSYNSRQPSVAKEMSDMVLPDEAAGLNWINWINPKLNVEAPCQVLAVTKTDDHRCIGLVGVTPQPKIHGEVEILFAIADAYQNNGYATEAARALIDWFFETKKDMYLCAIVKTNNFASQKVIEKLGFRKIEMREIVFDGVLTMFYYYRLDSTAA